MTLETFKNALDYTDYVSLGGGEPTIHPKFWEFFGLALGHCSEGLWLATNGSMTEIALTLAKIAKKGVIGCSLSRDEWHDPIDQRVVDAFKVSKISQWEQTNDGREIRTITSPVVSGRQKTGTDDCICEGLFVAPNGDVKPCGCLDAPVIGNVNTGFEYDGEERCHKKTEETEAA